MYNCNFFKYIECNLPNKFIIVDCGIMAYRVRKNSHIHNAVHQMQQIFTESGLYSAYNRWFNKFILTVIPVKHQNQKSSVKPLDMIRLDDIFKLYLKFILISALCFLVEIIWFNVSLKFF